MDRIRVGIYSKAHFVVSVVVGAVTVAALGFELPLAVVLVGAAGVVGVAIDFDHFLVARARTGSWEAARRVLRNPRLAFADQRAIFEEDSVGRIPRLLSHVLIAGSAVALLGLVDVRIALLVAVVLYTHLLCDLLADTRHVLRNGGS